MTIHYWLKGLDSNQNYVGQNHASCQLDDSSMIAGLRSVCLTYADDSIVARPLAGALNERGNVIGFVVKFLLPASSEGLC